MPRTPPSPSRAKGRYLALTGTPGVGKSSLARALPRSIWRVEVGELALATGTGTPRPGRVDVDLPGLGQWVRAHPPRRGVTVVVGHLAHLLPIDQVVLLRCHPLEVLRRLRQAHRGTPETRRANVASEALDVVLIEALRLGRSVRELDTTRRGPRSAAQEVARWSKRPLKPKFGTVDWLADPRVTDFLLRGPP